MAASSSSSSNTSLRLPFPIVPAERTPDARVVWLARAFGALEASGLGGVLGAAFLFVLALLRRAVRALGVDLSHIESAAITGTIAGESKVKKD